MRRNAWLADDKSNEKNHSQIFEFVNVPLFVGLTSCSSTEPVYFFKIEKVISRRMLGDCYGHTALDGDVFTGTIPTKVQIKENKQKAFQNS